MAGPKAPKDPERKRPYFYIMKDKDIYGSVQEDGSIIHFIYESDGRLINSAQIAGNIENKEELGLLETVEGFGRLVHSIGVSVETDNQNEQIEFVFQMYGKQDLYGGGTNLKVKLTGDGMERKIYLSDYKWTPDDDIPGQIKFIFNTPDIMGKASVRLYLNDGYEAPADIEETEVDMNSDEYCSMISHSLMNMGNVYRIRKAIEKTRAGKEVTLAYIGGSITQGAGAAPINTECYAYKSYQLFQRRFSAKNNVKFIKAGVGGTPSELGMIRFDRDVLRDGQQPDIVVIEFAVNDDGSEEQARTFEALVRNALEANEETAVIALYSAATYGNQAFNRKSIAEYYRIPQIDVLPVVKDGIAKGKFSQKDYYTDNVHPTKDGHEFQADCLMTLVNKTDEQNLNDSAEIPQEWLKAKPLTNFTRILGDDENVKIQAGGFNGTDFTTQSIKETGKGNFPQNWYHQAGSSGDSFIMEITCKALIFTYKEQGSWLNEKFGKAEVYVDGKLKATFDGGKEGGWCNCVPKFIIDESELASHTVEVRMAKGCEKDGFTIVAMGYSK